jgi:hypothetical protein
MAQVSYPDLFPFCIVETNDASLVGDGTYNPVGMDLEDALYFYWKCKKFDLVGSVIVGDGVILAGGLVQTAPDPPPQDETDLVCAINASYYKAGNLDVDPFEYAVFFDMFYGYSYKYNGLIYPYISLNAAGNSYNPGGATPFSYNALLVFNGNSFNIPMYYGVLGSSSGFGISETETWPYNP